MARMLSLIARHGCYVLAIVAWSTTARPVLAQVDVQVSPPTNVVANPFASEAQLPSAAPEEPAVPQRSTAPYRNPFATMRMAPSVAPPSRPGPVSRWRQHDLLADESSPVRNAILSASEAAADAIPWDQLPPGETLRDGLTIEKVPAELPKGLSLSTPPDPIEFAPRPLTQPAWLSRNGSVRQMPPITQSAALDSVSVSLFELPDTKLAPTAQAIVPAAGNIVGPSLADPGRAVPVQAVPVQADPVQAEIGQDSRAISAVADKQLLDAPPVGDDWSSIIVSDHADSPENCYTQAQELADTAESVDQLSQVIEVCQRGLGGGPVDELALTLRRLTAWAHNRRGELRSEAREQQDALADFQAAIRLDPNCWAAIHNRGVTFAQQGQSPAALRDFNRVLELNPGLAIAARNRAELLSSLGRMDEAVDDYTTALEQTPDDAELYRARAYAWQRLGDFDRALDDLNESLSLAPDQAEAYTQRGNLAAEQGEYDRALSNFQQALRFDADACETHRSLAWLWATCPDARYRDPEQAVKAAEQAVQLAPPGDSFALDALAAAHANAGHFDEAARIQQQAVAAAPSNVLASFQERLALYQQGQPYRSEPPRPAVEPAQPEVEPASYTAPTAERSPTLR